MGSELQSTLVVSLLLGHRLLPHSLMAHRAKDTDDKRKLWNTTPTHAAGQIGRVAGVVAAVPRTSVNATLSLTFPSYRTEGCPML